MMRAGIHMYQDKAVDVEINGDHGYCTTMVESVNR